MKHLHIQRAHQQGLDKARAIAKQWQSEGEQKWRLRCDYQTGDSEDVLYFKGSGISGQLIVTADEFCLDAELGFLLRPYRKRIESAILTNLDELLGASPTPTTTTTTTNGDNDDN